MRYAVLILSFLFLPSLVYAQPYWLKEGVYFKYVAHGDHSVLFVALSNSSIYRGSYGEFFWRVIKIEDDFATVEVVLRGRNLTEEIHNELSHDEGIEKLRELVSPYEKEKPSRLEGICEIYSVRNSTWGEGVVRICNSSFSLEFSNYTYALWVGRSRSIEFVRKTIPEIEKRAIFKINLRDNTLLINGTPVGKNLLFILPEKTYYVGEFLFNLSDQKVTVKKSIVLNDTIIHTPFKTFTPPSLNIQTSMVAFPHGSGGMDVLYYDMSSGILITGFMPASPLWKAFGFSSVVLFNEGSKVKKGEMNGFGMVLKETNADLTMIKPLEGTRISKFFLGLFIISILFLVFMAIIRRE